MESIEARKQRVIPEAESINHVGCCLEDKSNGD